MATTDYNSCNIIIIIDIFQIPNISPVSLVGNVVIDAVVDGDVEEVVCIVDKVANGVVCVCVVAKVVIWVVSVVGKVVNGVVSVVGKVVFEVASVVDKVAGGVVMVTVVVVWVVNAVTVVAGDVVLVVNVEVEEEDVVGTGGVVGGVWLITPVDSISMEDISNSMIVCYLLKCLQL